MNLQWFPGHMAKTRRLITDHLKLVDVVIELLDARLPLSSRNPEIDKIVGNRPRILVLNKTDIADPEETQKWLGYFTEQNMTAIAVDSQSGKGFSALSAALDRVLKEKIDRDKARGIQKHSIRMMVVGIPNVGKSSFINRLSGRSATRTGDRPGVTTAKQWIRIAGKYELLDTPGILWPKFESVEVARRIAFTGGIKDEIMDVEELACLLLGFLRENYAENLIARFKLAEDVLESMDDYDLLEEIGRKRGCVVSGGSIDTFRAASLVLDEFRAARIGAITLETPEDGTNL